jgi:hypothetical protein
MKCDNCSLCRENLCSLSFYSRICSFHISPILLQFANGLFRCQGVSFFLLLLCGFCWVLLYPVFKSMLGVFALLFVAHLWRIGRTGLIRRVKECSVWRSYCNIEFFSNLFFLCASQFIDALSPWPIAPPADQSFQTVSTVYALGPGTCLLSRMRILLWCDRPTSLHLVLDCFKKKKKPFFRIPQIKRPFH